MLSHLIVRALARPSILFVFLCACFLIACDTESDPTPQENPTPALISQNLPGALLGVWGSSATDVWVVGSDPGDGLGPYVLHFDGQTWTRLNSQQQGGLWWVWSQGPDASVWMSGENGLLLRYDRTQNQFTRIPTPQPARLFGVFPVSDQDVWIVGEDVVNRLGVLWHYDGTQIQTPADLPAEVANTPTAWFKVWGRSSEDLWIVGLGEKALHRTASGWQIKTTPRRLFTVHGDSTSRVVAVGGFASGLIAERAPTSTTDDLLDITPTDAPQFNGVWVSDDATITTAGIYGAIWQRTENTENSTWTTIKNIPTAISDKDFHAVYRDPEGGIWAVGGFVISEPLTNGLLVYVGERTLPTYP